MDVQVGLLTASALAGFLLRTAVEWLAAVALVRLAGSAQLRFRLWLVMLAAFAAQWAWTLTRIVRTSLSLHRPSIAARSLLASLPTRGGIAVSSAAASALTYAMAAFFALYSIAIAWQLSRAILARIRLARVLRLSREPGPDLMDLFRRACRGRDLHCELNVLPGLASPATVGWLRPCVLLPQDCEMQHEPELEAVFWHELKHVERRDALWNGIARACRALLWFHPVAHFAMRGLVAERELACDAAVVAEHPESCDVYAACLVRFARAVDLAASPAIADVEMASRATQLSVRVRSILAERQKPRLLSRSGRAGTSLLIAAMMFAALPSLAILLHLERTASAASFEGPSPRRIAAAFHRVRSKPAQGAAPTTQPPQITLASAAATPHDEVSAAQHRAAMGVLTQSTGMEGQLNSTDGAPAIDMHDADRSGHASGTWTSVAVDAAERMGPLLAGHDGDDRH